MSERLRVLVVEDSEDDAELVALELQRGGYDPICQRVERAECMIRAIDGGTWDLIVSDYSMPELMAPEALGIAQRMAPEIPFIVVSGTVGEQAAVACMLAGARDYLSKMNLARLSAAVARELEGARDRRNREQELERLVERLRRSNEELEQFAYVASHDLQEPLRMVTSYMELFAAEYHNRFDDRADKYIQFAVEGARRMKSLIDDLLEYSRVSSCGKPPTLCATGDVVDAELELLAETLEESKVSVVRGELPDLYADRGQLGQVFRNLISNAIKFRRGASPRIEISAGQVGEMWRFSVADDGIGIEADYAKRIFEMFQRLHDRDVYEGSGIGLTITKRIVERHGGRIWVESTHGVGSKFIFELPRAVENADENHEP